MGSDITRRSRRLRQIRRHERFEFEGTCKVIWKDANGNDKYVRVQGRDISKGGMRLIMPEALPLGTRVSVRAEQYRLDGPATVRICTRIDDYYITGFEFQGGLTPRALLMKPPPANGPQEVSARTSSADGSGSTGGPSGNSKHQSVHAAEELPVPAAPAAASASALVLQTADSAPAFAPCATNPGAGAFPVTSGATPRVSVPPPSSKPVLRVGDSIALSIRPGAAKALQPDSATMQRLQELSRRMEASEKGIKDA
jgi:hypothetical protein